MHQEGDQRPNGRLPAAKTSGQGGGRLQPRSLRLAQGHLEEQVRRGPGKFTDQCSAQTGSLNRHQQNPCTLGSANPAQRSRRGVRDRAILRLQKRREPRDRLRHAQRAQDSGALKPRRAAIRGETFDCRVSDPRIAKLRHQAPQLDAVAGKRFCDPVEDQREVVVFLA